MDRDKIRNILNVLFLIGALAAIILYFAYPNDRHPFMYVCLAALFLKMMEFVLRFMR